MYAGSVALLIQADTTVQCSLWFRCGRPASFCPWFSLFTLRICQLNDAQTDGPKQHVAPSTQSMQAHAAATQAGISAVTEARLIAYTFALRHFNWQQQIEFLLLKLLL